MRWSVAIGALAAGCYAPTVPANVPCGDGDACPAGQMCVADRCTSMPGPDLEPDADIPPPVDTLVDVADDAPVVPVTVSFGDRPGSVPNTYFDTFLSSGADEPNNFGNHADLHLTSGDEEPILVRVNLSSIPPGTTVTAARLRFEVTAESVNAGRVIDVFEMNESWTEGNGNQSAGVANHTQRNQNVEWSEHGAMPPSRDATAIASKALAATIDVGDELAIDLPVQLVAGWVANPATNFGIAIIVAGDNVYCELGSTQGGSARRPILELTLLE